MAESAMKLPLFDDYWLDFRRGTVRRWFAPEFHARCEGGPYASLIYDPERKKYRLYYEQLIDWAHDGPRVLKMLESDDMLNFERVYSASGSDVLFGGGSGMAGASIMYDPHDADPNRRYKFCGMIDTGGKPHVTPVVLGFSPDGVAWEAHPELVANSQISDALNKLFYNPITGEYTLLHRSAFVDRRISMRTSRDLKEWSEAHIILQPGTNYNDGFTGMQQYSMTARYFGGIFYGLVWRYNTCLYDMEFSRMFGYMEPELVYSYDGREFLYTTNKPIIERPLPPNPGCTGLSPEDICESADGRDYYIVCFGAMFVHGTEKSNKLLGDELARKGLVPGAVIYKIRKDGFCGIESVAKGGMVVTKGIELLKDDLSFNVRANCGSVRFALMNIDGTFVDGFSFDNCHPYAFDDGVDVRPTWNGHSLNEVLGRQVRIAVELNTAILHCISGTARPHVRQAMRSFADPTGIGE